MPTQPKTASSTLSGCPVDSKVAQPACVKLSSVKGNTQLNVEYKNNKNCDTSGNPVYKSGDSTFTLNKRGSRWRISQGWSTRAICTVIADSVITACQKMWVKGSDNKYRYETVSFGDCNQNSNAFVGGDEETACLQAQEHQYGEQVCLYTAGFLASRNGSQPADYVEFKREKLCYEDRPVYSFDGGDEGIFDKYYLTWDPSYVKYTTDIGNPRQRWMISTEVASDFPILECQKSNLLECGEGIWEQLGVVIDKGDSVTDLTRYEMKVVAGPCGATTSSTDSARAQPVPPDAKHAIILAVLVAVLALIAVGATMFYCKWKKAHRGKASFQHTEQAVEMREEHGLDDDQQDNNTAASQTDRVTLNSEQAT